MMNPNTKLTDFSEEELKELAQVVAEEIMSLNKSLATYEQNETLARMFETSIKQHHVRIEIMRMWQTQLITAAVLKREEKIALSN